MGAKFKAPLDSCCLAEEQHFRLPLPSYVCLSFLLHSFHPLVPHSDVSFIVSLFHFSAPAFFFSFLRPPSLYLASTPLFPHPFFGAVYVFYLIFSIWFCGTFGSLLTPLFSSSPLLYLNPAFITYASLSNLTDIDQDAAAGMLSWCKFVQRAHI